MSSLWSPRSSSWVNWWSHLLDDFLQHTYAKLLFIVILSLCHPTSNVWDLLLIYILSSFCVASVLDLSHSNRFTGVSHCYFNLYFPDDIRCAASFHMLICHPYIFGEMPVKIFGPFFKLTVFFLMSFKSSLYILDNNHLSDMPLQIFSLSLWLIF